MASLQAEMSYLLVMWQRWSRVDHKNAYKTAITRHIVYHQPMVSRVSGFTYPPYILGGGERKEKSYEWVFGT